MTDVSSSYSLVIDGIDKKILFGSTNVFGSSDLTDFPTLQPGDNEIDISGASQVVAEWYPVWQ